MLRPQQRRTPYFAFILVLVGACDAPPPTPVSDPHGQLEDWLNDQNGDGIPDDTQDPGEGTVIPPEDPPQQPVFCTFEDADKPCETDKGEAGTSACVAGELQCWVCQPGEKRAMDCRCDVQREDTCGANGRWIQGACDGCSEDPVPVPCGFCGQEGSDGTCVGAGSCEPGTVEFRRCDACPEGESCNATSCVGEKWVCSDGCEWEKVEGCGIRPPQCDRDARKHVPCGACGDLLLTCDGCFWDRPDSCDFEADCYPGEYRQVDCFANGCKEGFGSTISCNNNCMWNNPSRCVGCTEGWHTEWQDCVPGRRACGQKEIQYYCTVPTADGTCDVPIGTKGSFSVLTACPPIECYPGQTRSEACMTDSGVGGQQTMKCGNDCTWPATPGACTASTSSCVPGTQKVESKDCGCGISYTVTSTCRADGLGWVTETTGQQNCPECQPGDSQDIGCDGAGSCGVARKTCNAQCEWETSSCQQSAGACTNGETKQGSCYAACGGGMATYTCMGCRWVQTSSCYPSEAPACAPGERKQELCNPDFPECGYREDYCASGCQWIQGDCPPCG